MAILGFVATTLFVSALTLVLFRWILAIRKQKIFDAKVKKGMEERSANDPNNRLKRAIYLPKQFRRKTSQGE